MFVTLPCDDFVHRCVGDAMASGQVNTTDAIVELSAKGTNLVIAKVASVMAIFHRLIPLRKAALSTIAGLSINRVVLLRSGVKMRRIDTGSIVASVKGKLARFKATVAEFVSHAVRTQRNSGVANVPVAVKRGSLPHPARVQTTAAINLRPETRNELRGIIGAHRGVPPMMPCRGCYSTARHFHASIIPHFKPNLSEAGAC